MSSVHLTPSTVEGSPVDVPSHLNLFSFVLGDPFQHVAPPAAHPSHSFGGEIISPARPALHHDGSHASVSRARLRHDALCVARGLREIMGEPMAWDEVAHLAPGEAIHSPSTTVMLHAPNSLAFAPIVLGAVAACYAVSPLSPAYAADELAYFLAKARPHVIFTTYGEGAESVRRALRRLVERGPDMDQLGAQVRRVEVVAWAAEMASDFDELARRATAERGELELPWHRRRVWLVHADAEVDAYGTGLRRDTSTPAALDRRDWTNLLRPPPLRAASSRPHAAEPFQVARMQAEEQKLRVALLLWSSGTTGISKGVMLSHRNIVAAVTTQWHDSPWLEGPRFGGGEVWIALAPWYHVFGLVVTLLTSITIGATLVIPASPRFDLETYLRTVTRHRATFAHIAPSVAVALRDTPLLDAAEAQRRGIDLSSIRGFLSGGAPVPPEVIRRVHARTSKLLQSGFGTTEALCVTCSPSLHLDDAATALGSTGRAFCNVRLAIRAPAGSDAEQVRRRTDEVRRAGAEARRHGLAAPDSPSVCGELVISSPSVMLGYFSGAPLDPSTGRSAVDARLTGAAMTSDGWYRTGDEGVLDRHGNLWITGRLKELIKVKGFQVPPAELDALFARSPLLADAAAGSIVDEDGAEHVVLYATPRNAGVLVDEERQRSTANSLAEWAQSRLAHYKRPKYYVFVPRVPRNPTGKVLRKDFSALPGTRHEPLARPTASSSSQSSLLLSTSSPSPRRRAAKL